jgi:hypothetical protein
VPTKIVAATPAPPTVVPATFGINVLQHTAPVPSPQMTPMSQPGGSQNEQDVYVTSEIPIATAKQPTIPSPVKPEFSMNREGLEQQSDDIAMVGARVEEVAEGNDEDIAMNEGANVSVSQQEKNVTKHESDVTMIDEGASTADGEGNVTMEDDASGSACNSSFSSSFGLSFGSTLGSALNPSLNSSLSSQHSLVPSLLLIRWKV